MMMNSAVRLLDRAAARWPDRPAAEDEEQSLTYREYREVSRRVGSGLIAAGCQGRPVVVYLPKSVKMLTVFMGTMYAGGPYVPVDANIPLTRLEKIIDSVRPGAVVTDEDHRGKLEGLALQGARVCLYDELAGTEADEAAIAAALDAVVDTDPIYVMYTSGSTGTPKGVTIPHRGILDYAVWVTETFGCDESTVMANQSAFYFDNSTFDIYGCLQCGGKLLLIPETLIMFPAKLPDYLREKAVTSIFWVPTVMIALANSGALEGVDLPALKTVAFCGEVMPNKTLNIWRRCLPGRTYANLYGPTEITDVCCYYIVDRPFADADPLPIGRACENMRVVLLTEDGREAKVGEQGELCVIGTGVALGYWNAPELTEKVFTPNPLRPAFPERMYRTGDIAYWSEEGLLMFLGRRDSQIKLRGNRIELGEIENAAMCVAGVENACAVFDAERQEIVLFVESRETFVPRKFNLALKKYIPAYMLPGRLVTMAALPHTANGKIDRVTLRNSLREG